MVCLINHWYFADFWHRILVGVYIFKVFDGAAQTFTVIHHLFVVVLFRFQQRNPGVDEAGWVRLRHEDDFIRICDDAVGVSLVRRGELARHQDIVCLWHHPDEEAWSFDRYSFVWVNYSELLVFVLWTRLKLTAVNRLEKVLRFLTFVALDEEERQPLLSSIDEGLLSNELPVLVIFILEPGFVKTHDHHFT